MRVKVGIYFEGKIGKIYDTYLFVYTRFKPFPFKNNW